MVSVVEPRSGTLARLGRRFIWPILLLTGLALLLFWGLYSADYYVVDAARDDGTRSPLERYLSYDPQSITDAISALTGVVVAVLGIVITVVSIVVQLSAARFKGIARMFLRDRVNVSVIGYYVVVCVCGVWLSVALHRDYVPHLVLSTMLVLTSAAVILIVPYFGYVFWFLEPMNIIERIRNQALTTAVRGSVAHDSSAAAAAQGSALLSLEELTDIASASISGKDKIIASGAVDALKDLALGYLKQKPNTDQPWFLVHGSMRENPDFVAMDPESLRDLEQRRTWLEWKIMRQYLAIYNEALEAMRDINYLIAIDTRYIAEAAALVQDTELVRLGYRYMNSYLRATLNARDVRTAYNVLNQYRLLLEALLKGGHTDAALEGLRHMIYYGHVSFDMKLTFVTETVAYDVSTLVEAAHALQLDVEQSMLESFLDLDRPLRTQSQEGALVGIRKAQVKLAAYYLAHGQDSRARRIAEDMADEPKARLLSIFSGLSQVVSKDFWEIIDRGRNFEFMPAEQRAKLPEFFAWLGVPKPDQTN